MFGSGSLADICRSPLVLPKSILFTQNRWFTRVSESGSTELQRVAAGMETDTAAICEAITSSWSNGVVEGHVNRLKMLKRQMIRYLSFFSS
ncbi:transposase [Salmonella enterica]|nr:transposase [Salmonella enterica]EDU6783786.1 transposase [Salmonella enterica subsp. enterica serovar Gaminara]EGB2528457.1 transposase [Salmonella enterica]EIC5002063.1 transposase [Salmonella enterica]EIJ3932359.1 transposase [Salmonella enterica]